MLIQNPFAVKDQGHLNQVLVVGRVTAAPTVRELPRP